MPLLNHDCIFDFKGCTTSISFVHDILFPFARTQLEKHLKILDSEEVEKIANSLDRDLEKLDANHASRLELKDKTELTVSDRVYALMNHDVKATALKGLQGQIWKAGYTNRELKGHIYQDFLPLLQWCKLTDVNVYIYSSGSIGAQKLLFGNSIDGDLLSYLKGHFDTTSGNKKEHTSYQTIAKAIDVGT
jgi:2,3-diketo-5-methylthio-1-phosphopentane phosphatase